MKKVILGVTSLILILGLLTSCGTKATESNIYEDSSVTESEDILGFEDNTSSLVETDVISDTKTEVSTENSSISASNTGSYVSIPTDDHSVNTEGADDSPAPKTKVFDGNTYELTFEDTFTGDELDTTKWTYSPEEQRQNLGGYWSDYMTEVSNGALVLWATCEDGIPLSGAVETSSAFRQTYGYFEARIKLPEPPKCYWCAFWLMTGNVASPALGGINGAELDVMESITNKSNTVQHNIHWDGYASDHKSTGAKYRGQDLNLYEGWHVFAVLWTEKEYVFYIDDQVSWRVDPSEYDGMSGTCNKDGYMLLSIEFGKSTGFSTVQEDQLPSYMLVDWVHAYKKV